MNGIKPWGVLRIITDDTVSPYTADTTCFPQPTTIPPRATFTCKKFPHPLVFPRSYSGTTIHRIKKGEQWICKTSRVGEKKGDLSLALGYTQEIQCDLMRDLERLAPGKPVSWHLLLVVG